MTAPSLRLGDGDRLRGIGELREGLLRLHRDRTGSVEHPVVAGDGEHEVRSDTELRPERQGPAVEGGVAEGDRQTEPRAADGALSRRVRAPESVEHPLRVSGVHPEPEVADTRRHRVLVAVHRDDHRASLAVLDRVADEVAQHPPHAPRVHVHRRVPAWRHETDLRAVAFRERPHLLDDVFRELRETRRLQLELHGPRPHAEIARREPRARLRRLHDRGGHGPQHDPGDGCDDGHQSDAGDPQGALHEDEGL
ncbi:unnamed protein product, partial [Penicillium discolor]